MVHKWRIQSVVFVASATPATVYFTALSFSKCSSFWSVTFAYSIIARNRSPTKLPNVIFMAAFLNPFILAVMNRATVANVRKRVSLPTSFTRPFKRKKRVTLGVGSFDCDVIVLYYMCTQGVPKKYLVLGSGGLHPTGCPSGTAGPSPTAKGGSGGGSVRIALTTCAISATRVFAVSASRPRAAAPPRSALTMRSRPAARCGFDRM